MLCSLVGGYEHLGGTLVPPTRPQSTNLFALFNYAIPRFVTMNDSMIITSESTKLQKETATDWFKSLKEVHIHTYTYLRSLDIQNTT